MARLLSLPVVVPIAMLLAGCGAAASGLEVRHRTVTIAQSDPAGYAGSIELPAGSVRLTQTAPSNATATGDIDGDGHRDLVSIVQRADGTSRVRAVSLGRRRAGATVDLDAQAPLQTITSPRSWQFGGLPTIVGDVNGDGRADIALSEVRIDPADPARLIPNAHAIFVIFSGVGGTRYTIGDNPGVRGLRIDFPGPESPLLAARPVGDVNGDGHDDVAFGLNTSGATATTSAGGVVFGGRSGTVAFARLGAGGVRFDGRALPQSQGSSVDGIGDVDDDGLADLLVTSQDSARRAYVVLGRRSGGFAPLARAGYWLDDTASAANARAFQSGTRGAALGDTNGDGVGDFAVVPFYQAPQAGSVAVVFGTRRRSNLRLDRLGRRGFRIVGSSAEQMGGGYPSAVSGPGDINGDGLADILVGAQTSAYVVFGSRIPHGVSTTSLGARGFAINPPVGSGLGGAVAGLGDLDGDGRNDLLVSENGGTSYAVVGRPVRVPTSRLASDAPILLAPTGEAADAAGAVVVGTARGRAWLLLARPDDRRMLVELTALVRGIVPRGVAIDRDGTIWIGDRAHDRLVALDRDATRVLRTIRLGLQPSSLLLDGSRVWVAADDGTILRVATGSRALTLVARRGGPITALARTEGALWILRGEHLEQIADQRATPSAPTVVGIPDPVLAFSPGGGLLWLVLSQPMRVVRLAPASGAVVGAPTAAGVQHDNARISATGEGVWIAGVSRSGLTSGIVNRIDPRTGLADGRAIGLPTTYFHPRAVLPVGRSVWVVDRSGRLARVETFAKRSSTATTWHPAALPKLERFPGAPVCRHAGKETSDAPRALRQLFKTNCAGPPIREARARVNGRSYELWISLPIGHQNVCTAIVTGPGQYGAGCGPATSDRPLSTGLQSGFSAATSLDIRVADAKIARLQVEFARGRPRPVAITRHRYALAVIDPETIVRQGMPVRIVGLDASGGRRATETLPGGVPPVPVLPAASAQRPSAADPRSARVVTTLPTRAGTLALIRSGSRLPGRVCTWLTLNGKVVGNRIPIGGCRRAEVKIALAQAVSVVGVGPRARSTVVIVGLLPPGATRLQVRYRDGRVRDLPVRQGAVVSEITRADMRPAHRPAVLIERDRSGREIDRYYLLQFLLSGVAPNVG